MKTKIIFFAIVLFTQTCLGQIITVNVDTLANGWKDTLCISSTTGVLLTSQNCATDNHWTIVNNGDIFDDTTGILITPSIQGEIHFKCGTASTKNFWIWFDEPIYQAATIHDTVSCKTTINWQVDAGNLALYHMPKYQWKKNGVLVGTNRLYTITTLNDIYTITITNKCSSETYTINASYSNPNKPNLGPDQTVCAGTGVVLNANVSNGSTWAWNTGAPTATINVNSSGTYSVFATDANSCNGYDTVNVTVSTSPSIPIKVVTANMNYASPNFGDNIISWDSLSMSNAVDIKIYRQTGGNYVNIATIPYTDGSYQDNLSSEVQAQWYKISVIDTCGNEGPLSGYFKSLKAWSYRTLSDDVIVTWEPVLMGSKGIQSYEVYKFVGGIPVLIGTANPGDITFTDVNATINDTSYAAAAVISSASAKTTFKAFSNPTVVPDTITGIQNHDIQNINIYTTPDNIIINGDMNNFEVSILDITGHKLMTIKDQKQIDISNLQSGIYMINISSEGRTITTKKIAKF